MTAASRLAHNLLHSHTLAVKEGLGVFQFCGQRLPPSRCKVAFQPDLPGAGWHRVPARESRDGTPLLTAMLFAGDPYEAMALLRAALEEQ